ncbi:MAG: DMT family transporter, partial [Paraclostridium sp.]
VYKQKEKFFGKKENRKLLFLRATTGTLGVLFNFYAIGKLVLSDANMLNQLSSFFAIILAAIFLKEKVKTTQVISIIIAFVGALFIIRPQFNLDIIPALIGVLGAICAASSYTCLRSLGKKEQGATVVFVFSLFSLVVIFPFMLETYKHMNMLQLLYLILAGVSATIGQFGITWAYKYAPAKEISIFNYTNVIFSAIISIILFNVIPDEFSIIGYIIIFSAALYMFMYNKKLDKTNI